MSRYGWPFVSRVHLLTLPPSPTGVLPLPCVFCLLRRRYPADPYDRIWISDNRKEPIQDEIGTSNFSVSPSSTVRFDPNRSPGLDHSDSTVLQRGRRGAHSMAGVQLQGYRGAGKRLGWAGPGAASGTVQAHKAATTASQVAGDVNAVPSPLTDRAREFASSTKRGTHSYVFSGLDFPGDYQVRACVGALQSAGVAESLQIEPPSQSLIFAPFHLSAVPCTLLCRASPEKRAHSTATIALLGLACPTPHARAALIAALHVRPSCTSVRRRSGRCR